MARRQYDFNFDFDSIFEEARRKVREEQAAKEQARKAARAGTRWGKTKTAAAKKARAAGRSSVRGLDKTVAKGEETATKARTSKIGNRAEYFVKGKKRSKSTSLVHVPGKGTGAASRATETANEQHLRLMREKLGGMDPLSHQAKKLRTNIDSLEGHLGVKGQPGGPKTKRPFSERVSGSFNHGKERAAGAGKNSARKLTGWIYKGGSDPRGASNAMAQGMVGGAALYVGGIGLGYAGREKAAKINASKKKRAHYMGSKEQNRHNAMVRWGNAATTAGVMTFLGAKGLAEGGGGVRMMNARHVGVNLAVVGGLGAVAGYGVGRIISPKNRISSRQRAWITYTRRSGGGTKRVRRKNPYFGKPEMAKAARKKNRQNRIKSIKRKVGRR